MDFLGQIHFLLYSLYIVCCCVETYIYIYIYNIIAVYLYFVKLYIYIYTHVISVLYSNTCMDQLQPHWDVTGMMVDKGKYSIRPVHSLDLP